MHFYREHAGELLNDSALQLKSCPFCGGYWEVVPILQTCRYSAMGVCIGCGAMVMTVDEHATPADAISELIRRINSRSNSDCEDD